jgi:hypothetical protein
MPASTRTTLAPHCSHTVRCAGWFHKQPVSRIFATRTRKARPTRKATREVQDLWLGAHTIQYVSTTTWVQLPSATSTSSCAATTRLQPHALYVNLAVLRDYSSLAARALCQPRRVPRLLVTQPHVLYVNLVVHREYSSPLSRLQQSTSPSPRVRVPRLITRLVTWLVAPLVVDYSASRRLVVDYLAYTARPGASARRGARHAARRATRRRLLVVDYFAFAACSGASARHAARRAARR